MWENADETMRPPEETGKAETKKGKKPPRGSEDELVLWAQLILCGLILAGVLAARELALPLYPALRTAFDAAMQDQAPYAFDEERGFVKFAQGRLWELQQAASEVFAQLNTPQQEVQGAALSMPVVQARLHSAPQREVPSGCREESYLPAFPVGFPLPGKLYEQTSGYGWRIDPVQGTAQEFHIGADLAVGQGTPVLAAAEGVVRYAGSGASYGNYVRILHDDGDETIYAHMQYLFVRTGQHVQAGQTLGTVGQTGNATGPHLHFEILHEGVRYDPSELLETAPAP